MKKFNVIVTSFLLFMMGFTTNHSVLANEPAPLITTI